MTEKPNVTLPGKVEKIIESSHPSEPEKAEISIEGGDPLYQEIRIENSLTDEDKIRELCIQVLAAQNETKRQTGFFRN